MTTLNVTEFSCLKEATFTLAPVNVIIGPQGSGKSVTTKLFYFLSEILTRFLISAERNDSFDQFKSLIGKEFKIWFPPSAWGSDRFNIGFTQGNFSVRLLRRKSGGMLKDDVAITFSDWFSENYRLASDQFEKSRSGEGFETDLDMAPNEYLDKSWRVRDLITRRISKEIGVDYISNQTFIPAGRAFFTSIGRIVAGFEQAGSLDPITIKFARQFANLRDRKSIRTPIRVSEAQHEATSRNSAFMMQLFGGEIKYESDEEYVESSDGRRIPFSSLSSGQQELLPMWSLMEYFSELDIRRQSARFPNMRRNRDLLYIEEPEAHLFPSAQSLLMEFLIGSVVSEKKNRSLIITTHSPYIMGKLNIFLKAGQLARRKKRNQEINDIVPRDCWLNANQLNAISIENGKLRSLIDEDGLIDGRYLDSISEQLSREFSDLLQIESEI